MIASWSYPNPYPHVELSGSHGGTPKGCLLSLVLTVRWPAHLTVFQCSGAVDDQNFGALEFIRENLGVGTFPWGQ